MKSQRKINLDKAATASVNKRFLEDIKALAEDYYNPSSANSESVRIRNEIEEVREKVAKLLGCEAEQIYFVSGASEGNAMLTDGFEKAHTRIKLQSVAEHPSINRNEDVYPLIPIDNDGKIIQKAFDLMEEGYYVTIGYANSETGVIQDIKSLVEIAHKKNIYFMSDLTTVVGKIPVNVKELDLDAAVFSGHKFHALKGVGVVYIKNKEDVMPIIHGTQENGMRGGTLNSLAIRSLGYAIDDIDFDRYYERTSELRKRLLDGIKDIKEVSINSPSEDCLPSIISISIDIPISGQNVVGLFDDKGIIISAGTACASYEEKLSSTLVGMGLSEEVIRKSIRISWDDENTLEEIDTFVSTLKNIIEMFESEDVPE